MWNERLKTTEGERLLDYRGLRQARSTSAKMGRAQWTGYGFLVCAVLPFFAKVGLACETRKEAVNSERLCRKWTPGGWERITCILCLCMNACVQLYFTLMLLVFCIKKKKIKNWRASYTDFWSYCLEHWGSKYFGTTLICTESPNTSK